MSKGVFAAPDAVAVKFIAVCAMNIGAIRNRYVAAFADVHGIRHALAEHEFVEGKTRIEDQVPVHQANAQIRPVQRPNFAHMTFADWTFKLDKHTCILPMQ